MNLEEAKEFCREEVALSLEPVYAKIKEAIRNGRTGITVSTNPCAGPCQCILINHLQLRQLREDKYTVSAAGAFAHHFIDGW